MAGRARHLRLAGHEQRLRHQRADDAGLSGSRNLQPFQRRVVADVVRRVAVRDLPQDLAAIEADRRDAAVGRLDDRQALDRQPGTAALTTATAARAASGGWCRRRWRQCRGRCAAPARGRCRTFRDRHRRSSRSRAHRHRRARAGQRAALDVVHVVLRGIGLDQSEHARRSARVHVQDARLGIERAARPDGSAAVDRQLQRAERSLGAADRRRRVDRSDLVTRDDLLRFGAQFGREVDQVVLREAVQIVLKDPAACVERKRLRRRVPLARARRLSRPAALRSARSAVPVTRSRTKRNACLVGCASALIALPLTVMSTRMGAHGMSWSQMPWCTVW